MNQRICSAIFDSDLISTRLTLAVAEALWAVLLWWPGDTFDRPTYTVMAHIAPEDFWGFMFAGTAIGQLTVIANGCFLSRPARVFAAWNAALWMFVVVAMLLSVQPPPAAISGEIALAMAAMWVWVRPMILAHWYWKAYGGIYAR